MISSELPELLGMSDRILVMYRGRIQAEFDAASATQERVLSAALGLASLMTSVGSGLSAARQFGTLIGLVVLSLVLWALTPHFLTVQNLLNIAQQTSINAIVAVGMTYVILSGGIDLSVGSIVALSGVALGAVLQDGQPAPVAMLAAIAVGVGVRARQRRARQLGRPAAVHRDARA